MIKRNQSNGNPLIALNYLEYKSWVDAKSRCYNIKNKGWKDYGARGITMCDRWENNFNLFLLDMGKKPTPNHTIERNDVNGNYEPSNCRWVTKLEQGANTRRSVYIDYNGVSVHLTEWARKLKISQPKFYYHYKKYGGIAAIEKLSKSII